MTGASRPRRGGAPRQPWSPDQSGGVTCPSCGLHNEPGARVCRNCGLPIASATDPLRGVTPGRIDMPSVRNSGISATVGLVAVVAVLLVAGTLAVSGDGFLSRGGLIGAPVDPGASGAPASPASAASTRAPTATQAPRATPTKPTTIGATTEYSCAGVAIRDPEKGKWRLGPVEAGVREGYERVTLELQRTGKTGKAGTVTTEWLTPAEAAARFGIPRPSGTRALVLAFTGTVTTDSNRIIDTGALDGAGLRSLRSVQVFVGEDGRTHGVVGVRGEGCARLSSPAWRKKGLDRSALVYLDVETG